MRKSWALGFLVAASSFAAAAPAATNFGTQATAQAGAIRAGNPYAVSENSGFLPARTASANAHYSTSNYLGSPAEGEAHAYVDLAGGRMGVSASSEDGGKAYATARMEDRLLFNVAGAEAYTITPITVELTYHGAFGQPGSSGEASSNFRFSLTPSTSSGAFVGFHRFSAWYREDEYRTANNSGWADYSITPLEGDVVHFRGVYNLVGVSQELDLLAYIDAQTRYNSSADFSNTASLLISLPDNVSYTSESGVFLTQAGLVPEPTTWAMMIAGFGLVGGTLRRRARQPVAPLA